MALSQQFQVGPFHPPSPFLPVPRCTTSVTVNYTRTADGVLTGVLMCMIANHIYTQRGGDGGDGVIGGAYPHTATSQRLSAPLLGRLQTKPFYIV